MPFISVQTQQTCTIPRLSSLTSGSCSSCALWIYKKFQLVGWNSTSRWETRKTWTVQNVWLESKLPVFFCELLLVFYFITFLLLMYTDHLCMLNYIISYQLYYNIMILYYIILYCMKIYFFKLYYIDIHMIMNMLLYQ